MIRLITILFFIVMGISAAFAQGQGELSGRVTDEKGEGIPFASVVVEKGGSLVTGAQTDFEGYYIIKPLPAGNYDVKVSNIGYTTSITEGVRISSDKITTLDKTIKVESTLLGAVEVTSYRVPLIDKDEPSSKNTITAEEIKSLPTRDVQSIASTSAGVYQEDEGDEVSIRGSRTNGTEYYVDGIRVTGSTNIPPQAIEQLTVIQGGLPAKYGDATGGVINIVTKGPSNRLNGGVEVITSQGMDAVGYNDVNFNLTGPIWTKYKGTDSSDARIGYFIAGEYLRQQDPDPSAIGVWKVKDDKFAELETNPLILSPVSDAFILAAQRLTLADLEKVKSKPNVASNTVSGSAKIDFKVTDNISVTIGGNMNYAHYHDFVDRYTLLNYVNNPLYKELTWRTFARLTQRFGKTNLDPQATKSAFQNAYYSLQFDYSKVYNTYQDDSHGFSPFEYGYVGKFDLLRKPTYSYDDDITVFPSGNIRGGYVQGLDSVYAVVFTPSDVNPTTTNFMTSYYSLAGDDTSQYYGNLATIQQNNGLLNGDRPDAVTKVYNIWTNTGRQFNGYAVNADDDQFRVSLQGSVDIQRPGSSSRNKHSLEFGFEFEQRILRHYDIQPIGLWELMRQEANFHLTEVDPSTAQLLINGVVYDFDDPNRPAFGENDTVLLDYAYDESKQTYFDKKLREKLGIAVDSREFINTDALSPETFSLDMFSADELFNGGNPYVNYYGYDYTGKKLGGNVSFNDFFTQKDESGNFTRVIGAFKPIYSAAYLQDKFQFKDLLFNVGVRIDRYDANQKVLKDPYSLYQVFTVDEVEEKLADFQAPSNIGGDYVVYVDREVKNITDQPNVVGYRNGDTWYNATGEVISDPKEIAVSGGTPVPFLNAANVNEIKDENFDPNASFEDYTPQINVMPRLSFSFNITDEALFFAHYDILTQRPSGRNQPTPDDYYFQENNVGGAIQNANLKPERTIDYEVGFRQRISNNTAITFSAFYRELKDMIQLVNYTYAYPRAYLTWGNIDFGTVKGFSFQMDMRKSKTSNLSAKVNYTIQFAEGTGSDDISQSNIVQAGQPNLRTIAPLDYDARHTFNAVLDYRFDEGKDYNGPKVKGKDILANFGVNLVFRGRSGTPYTQQANPTATAIEGAAGRTILEGSKNGSRLPWNFRVDMRIDKSFNITSKKTEDQNKRNYYLNVYLLIQNLLNTRNIISIYNYTGNPDDDGYLTSPIGQQAINAQVYQSSYVQLYNTWVNNPNNYSLPRQIRIGVAFNF
ncbi:MAG: carboxypeptidase regulatory-like domain-containing protein [Chitinophagales bacterium]|nr:carboxypeptidase regulatory-like domain-containing protein [Chitinophagales bacterium]